MQTTLTASLIDNQPNILEIKSQLDKVIVLHSIIQRKIYKDIITYLKINNVNKLPNSKINELKSNYQLTYNINARHFNSIYAELAGKICSVLELNKGYLIDSKENIKSLEKSLKSKHKTLDSLVKNINKKGYIFNYIDQDNRNNLIRKIYYLNQKFANANKKLSKLINIEKTGNPHLCFGSKKLFKQQFQINTKNNLTQFNSHEEWKNAWINSRNKSFFFLGSSDENSGNQNCQIKHIENDTYELKLNVNPKETKLADRYVKLRIQLHNDKNNLIKNILKNNISQAITYRFYKDYKKDTFKVFISLDKSKQQPQIISYKLLGCVGIDINADHLSMVEINHDGNLLKALDFPLNLKGKSTNQALDNIACAIKQITDYAVKVNKPIVIEQLNFNQKKSHLKSGFNKKYNIMLSGFAYSKILELIKSRSFDKGIECIEVNPAYTSKIGKFKYQELYKLTTHQAASFVIARRGLLSYEKFVKLNNKNNIIYDKIITVVNKEKTISNRRSKYYPFDLPVRNNQKQDNIYWKEIEQNYLKAKKYRIDLKRKKLILDKQVLSRETTLVAHNSEVYRDLNPVLLFQPF